MDLHWCMYYIKWALTKEQSILQTFSNAPFQLRSVWTCERSQQRHFTSLHPLWCTLGPQQGLGWIYKHFPFGQTLMRRSDQLPTGALIIWSCLNQANSGSSEQLIEMRRERFWPEQSKDQCIISRLWLLWFPIAETQQLTLSTSWLQSNTS